MKKFKEAVTLRGSTAQIIWGTREEAYREGFDVKDIRDNQKNIFTKKIENSIEYFLTGDLDYRMVASRLILKLYLLSSASQFAFDYLTSQDFFYNPEKYLEKLYRERTSEVVLLIHLGRQGVKIIEELYASTTEEDKKILESSTGKTYTEVKCMYSEVIEDFTKTVVETVLLK